MEHHFTVDVEEHFQVSAFEGTVRREDWHRQESRVGASVDLLLDLMARHGARGTFFFVGMVAERHPALARAVLEAGHEVASHGYEHRRIGDLTPDQFRVSVRRTKELLEDQCGRPVLGYRAPSFSITPGREWALDILIEEGYRYDSSLFPVRRPGYGYANGQRDPHWIERPAGRIVQVPPSTLRRLGVNLPAAGGAYFRLLPERLVHRALGEAERRGVPGTFYIHPWEVDPGQPRIAAPLLARMRHYGGLERTIPRLERLLASFAFRPIAESLAAGGGPEPAGGPAAS